LNGGYVPWDGFTIWFITDGELAVDLGTTQLPAALDWPPQWAVWRVIPNTPSAEREVAKIKGVDDLPDIALIDGSDSLAARVCLTLENRARELEKNHTAYKLVVETGGTLSQSEDIVASIHHLFGRAEECCAELARTLLRSGEIPVSTDAGSTLRECVRQIDQVLPAWKSALDMYASDMKPLIRRTLKIGRQQEVQGVRGEVPFRELAAADSPYIAEALLRRARGPLGRFVIGELEQGLAVAKSIWDEPATHAGETAAKVWRILSEDDSFAELWRLAPFAGRRLWQDRGSVFELEETRSDIVTMCELLENSLDYSLALTKLLRLRHVGTHAMPVTMFAHGMHQWNYADDFLTMFGFQQPDDEEIRNEYMRAALHNDVTSVAPKNGRVQLPLSTIRRIVNDAHTANGGPDGLPFIALGRSSMVAEEWCVWPDVYLRQCWPAVTVVVSGRRNSVADDVLTDWREVTAILKRLFKLLEAPPSAIEVIYTTNEKSVELVFTLTAAEHLASFRPEAFRGGATGALRDLLPWCSVSLAASDTDGQISEASGPRFVRELTGRRSAEPFAQLKLTFAHYNHTRTLS
jgi:hypothetical protein